MPAKKEVFKNFRQVLSLESFFYTHQSLENRRKKFCVIYTLKEVEKDLRHYKSSGMTVNALMQYFQLVRCLQTAISHYFSSKIVQGA